MVTIDKMGSNYYSKVISKFSSDQKKKNYDPISGGGSMFGNPPQFDAKGKKMSRSLKIKPLL